MISFNILFLATFWSKCLFKMANCCSWCLTIVVTILYWNATLSISNKRRFSVFLDMFTNKRDVEINFHFKIALLIKWEPYFKHYFRNMRHNTFNNCRQYICLGTSEISLTNLVIIFINKTKYWRVTLCKYIVTFSITLTESICLSIVDGVTGWLVWMTNRLACYAWLICRYYTVPNVVMFVYISLLIF